MTKKIEKESIEMGDYRIILNSYSPSLPAYLYLMHWSCGESGTYLDPTRLTENLACKNCGVPYPDALKMIAILKRSAL